MAWDGHALAHQPLHFFQSNQFWPLHDTLAFSDALVGYAPAGLFGSGPHAAVFRYDLLFLFAYALAFFGAYLLARELGLGSGGGGGRRGGVRVRALPARAGRPHAGDLERRHPPRAGPRCPRLPAAAARVGGRRIGGRRLAALDRLHARACRSPICSLPSRRSRRSSGCGAGRPRLDRGLAIATVAGAILFAAAGSRSAARTCGWRTPTRRPAARRPTVEAYSGPPLDLPRGARREPRLGRGDRAASRRASERPREDPVPGPRDPRPRDRRAYVAPPIRAGCVGGSGVAVLVVSILALGFRAGGGLLWPYRDRLRASCPAGRRSGFPGGW